MKRYTCLFVPLFAAIATPALASEAGAAPTVPTTAVQSHSDAQAMTEQTRRALARLREALEARKQAAKDAAPRPQQEAGNLCSDCPDKDAATNHHSASEERKVDSIECIDHPVYA